ncbi:MAG TPA: hypothetical protein VD735_04735, partial [Candidatus Saccharimonadales bacterium]|nr:hypothetical protein [Candidatus Saccharimonadales bacterium]
ATLLFFDPGENGSRAGNAILVAQAVLSVSALPFFLRARQHFKGGFRRIYILLGAGIGLLGVAQLQTVIVALTGFLFWVDSGLIAVAFILATILIFISMRRFAQLLHLRTHWTSLGWVGLAAFLAAGVTGFVPYIPGALGDTYSPTLAFSAWTATLALLAALLVGHISRTISGIYTVALGRLNIALWALTFASAQYIGISALFPYDAWIFSSGIASVALVVASALFLWASVAFNFIGEYSPEREGIEKVTSLNIITYVASLASDQEAIDDILDGVRQISATLAPGETPDQEMQHQLAAIYLQLEEYLVTKETVQDFTSTSLRERIQATLGLDTAAQDTFWPIITGKAFDMQPEV